MSAVQAPLSVAVGDFVCRTLVTDSVGYVVTKVSPSGNQITIVPAARGEVVARENNGSPFPVVRTEIVAPSSVDGYEIVLRRRKDGKFRIGSSALYPAPRIDGKPVTRTDYSL